MRIWCNVCYLSLIVIIGMSGVAFAGPLLSPPEPFSSEVSEATPRMVIVVQELTNPLNITPGHPSLSLSDNSRGEPVDVEDEPASQQSDTSAVPEPSTLWLVGLGVLGGLWGLKRYKRLTRRNAK